MRYYKQIILSLIVLSCAFITGNAQEELLFRHLTRNEGLLHDNVTCIVQDSLGYSEAIEGLIGTTDIPLIPTSTKTVL